MSLLVGFSLSSFVCYCLVLCYYLHLMMRGSIGGAMAFSSIAVPLLAVMSVLALIASGLLGALVYRELSLPPPGRALVTAVAFVICLALMAAAPFLLPMHSVAYVFPAILLCGIASVIYFSDVY
jgi:hypothetical protein